jgi:predicted ATPase
MGGTAVAIITGRMNGTSNATCSCKLTTHDARRIVITGGPGAGKTALLETVRREFCEHIVVLPEAASIVYGGGFPRQPNGSARRAAQRAIYAVQRELERVAVEVHRPAVVLCDRGTLDGLAYWPGSDDEWLAEMDTTRGVELSRYAAVIHLRTPPPPAYNHQNPLRIESAAEAAALDARIEAVWAGHPHRHVIEHAASFLDKVHHALELIRIHVPMCCRSPARG